MANFWSDVGKDFEKAFAWFGSPKVQAALSVGEAAVEAIYPPADALLTVVNDWTAEAVKTEALAAQTIAAGGTSSSAIKAATTISAVTPTILAFAKQMGTPIPDASMIATANNYLIAFVNVLTGKIPAASSATTPVTSTNASPNANPVPETTVQV
jgi:hypothetical protein